MKERFGKARKEKRWERDGSSEGNEGNTRKKNQRALLGREGLSRNVKGITQLKG